MMSPRKRKPRSSDAPAAKASRRPPTRARKGAGRAAARPASDRRKQGRLLIVSNRLPIVLERQKSGWSVQPGQGGLVTAMAPVLRDRGGVWIGWPGVVEHKSLRMDRPFAAATRDAGYALKGVQLDQREMDLYYFGFSNEILWPLFHDLQTHCVFDPEYWASYRSVNRKFARVIKQQYRDGDFVWVHDYHLVNVGGELRDLGVEAKVGFFLHIPFPSLDIFLKMPWRQEILRGLIEYDLIGFQTMRDRRNFLQCVRALLDDVSVQGKGQVVTLGVGKRKVRVGAFAISIDYDEFARHAASAETSETVRAIHEDLPRRQLLLGIDRLDYTKGIPFRLKAYRSALRRHPELHGRLSLIQVVSPSRKNLPLYQDLKVEVDGLVGEINGEFTRPGWVPIHYITRPVERDELVAYYRACDVALVTPLKDGMNLVAKEFCACKIDDDGVLILSEFAGSAVQMQRGAILVNPYDIVGMGDAIHRAVTMPPEERQERMRKLRASIRKQDIFWWVESFLKAAIAKDLVDFPLLDEGTYLRRSSAV